MRLADRSPGPAGSGRRGSGSSSPGASAPASRTVRASCRWRRSTTPARVVPAIAQALGVVESEGRSAFDALAAHLAGRAVLLVLDNFEQVLDAAPDVAALLAASPRVKLVATSRAPLRVAGEQELAISPLARAPAVELFVSRARALDPRLDPGTGDLERIERICDRLDGLPLAIELAAARSKLLSPAAILERLEHRLDLLSAGPRDAPARQQTLRAAIGWSYDLLEPDVRAAVRAARRVRRRLDARGGRGGVRPGGARRPRDADGPEPRDRGRRALRDARDRARVRPRAPRRDDVRRPPPARAGLRRARRRADEGMRSRDVGAWLDRLHADRENLRAAIGFAAADGDAETALALCSSWRYWTARGNLTEGRALAELALASGDGPSDAAAARAQRRGRAGERAGRLRRGARAVRGEPRAGASGPGRRGPWRAPPPTSASWRSTRATSPRRSAATSGRSHTGATPGTCAGSASTRRTSGSPTAAPGSTSAPSSCWARASCSRARRAIRRTCPRRCARSPARCCSARARPRSRSSCSRRASPCRSSSTSARASSSAWRRSPRSSTPRRARS